MAILLGIGACALNPATGRRQLSLISEAQEIQMGREAAAGVRIDVVRVPTAMTISEFARRFDSAIPPETLAIINGLPGPESGLGAGTLAKRVVE